MEAGQVAKSKYNTHVKNRFKEIEEWISKGATNKEVAEMLGINEDTFYQYLKRYTEFTELIKRARQVPVAEIKAALYKRAIGFNYEEIRETVDHLGRWKTEKITKAALPDPASAMILLKHWDKEETWTQEPAMLELKKKELELKEKKIEAEEW